MSLDAIKRQTVDRRARIINIVGPATSINQINLTKLNNMDSGPELNWFSGPKERRFTPLEIASMEFGEALVESITTGLPIDPEIMEALSTEAAKEADKNQRMGILRKNTNQDALEELKQELLRDFGGSVLEAG